MTGLLNRHAEAVNFVWNYCNNTQKHALRWGRKWPSGFDFNKLTSGSSVELGLHSHTVNAVCEQYAKSRVQFKRPFLKYRNYKSLGWVPLKGCDLKRGVESFKFYGSVFRVFLSRPLPEGKIKDGTNFSRDRRGNWYLNIVIETPSLPNRIIKTSVGIDLGLKNFATFSSGETIDNPRYFRKFEIDLSKAQRARKKRRIKNIQSKIVNSRHDFLHKISSRIVNDYDYIVIGNVSPSRLAKTNMAKSVFDASWSSFRKMLAYKAVRHGVWYEEVDERFTSQICSACGCLPLSRPKGIADLGIREWQCSDCGSRNDRDTNAAINILRSGCRAPAVGIPA